MSAPPVPHSKALAAFFTKCCPTVPVAPATSCILVGIKVVAVILPVNIILLVAVFPAVNTSANVSAGVNAMIEPTVKFLVALALVVSVPIR